MLRNNIVPVLLVTVCGIATAVTTLQPELKRQSEGLPTSAAEQDTTISSAIKDDLQAARKELEDAGRSIAQPTGFGWGIRQALFGKPKENSSGQDTGEGVKPK